MPTASSVERIVVAGAGQAGARAAEALRSAGFRGSLTMIGAEIHPPYERPQLSKEMLADRTTPVAYLKPLTDWHDVLGVELILGTAVASCDARTQTIATADGRTFAYDRLLLATGTRPRRLSALGASESRVHYLRNVEDAIRLRQSFHAGARIVILGGGVIGLEAAGAAAIFGCHVTVVEREDRLLARAFPKLVSDVVEARHRQHGVQFQFGATATAPTPRGVRLSNDVELDADVILVGIGVEPANQIALDLDLPAGAGIEVDSYGQTAIPNIFCAGDVALQWSRCHDRLTRVETWANAQNQAICVAGNMIGASRAYADPPWFWSDQYDVNIQVVGDMLNADHVVRGDIAGHKFSVAAFRDRELVGAISFNAPKDMAVFRRLVASQAKPDPSAMESPSYDLRRALKSH